MALGIGSAHTPKQDWKLHVSARTRSSQEVMRRALPVLLAESASFKAAHSPRMLGMLDEGGGGESQIGKFITIYPSRGVGGYRFSSFPPSLAL